MNTTANQVSLKVISDNELQEIRNSIAELKDMVRAKNEESLTECYIESRNVPKLLKISNKTWQTYRDRRKFPFIQIGSKIWVKRTDIDAMMNKHYIKSKV
jgi:hypothetical protein